MITKEEVLKTLNTEELNQDSSCWDIRTYMEKNKIDYIEVQNGQKVIYTYDDIYGLLWDERNKELKNEIEKLAKESDMTLDDFYISIYKDCIENREEAVQIGNVIFLVENICYSKYFIEAKFEWEEDDDFRIIDRRRYED